MSDDLIADCLLAVECLAETNTFETGQAILKEAANRIEELEAKLAKAVMALQKIATVTKDGTGHNLAPVVRLAQRIEGISRATIAELKGEQP